MSTPNQLMGISAVDLVARRRGGRRQRSATGLRRAAAILGLALSFYFVLGHAQPLGDKEMPMHGVGICLVIGVALLAVVAVRLATVTVRDAVPLLLSSTTPNFAPVPAPGRARASPDWLQRVLC